VPLLRQNFPARCDRLTGITHGFPSANGRPDRARQFSSRAVSAGILQSSAGRPDGQLFVNGFLLPEFLDSEGTAALFRDGIFRLHGLPSSLVFDRGATCTSEFSRSLCCRLSGITHGFPSANGRPDRAHQFDSRAVSSSPTFKLSVVACLHHATRWLVPTTVCGLARTLVHWVVYNHPSWQPATNLEYSHLILERYHRLTLGSSTCYAARAPSGHHRRPTRVGS
jgi:hypothetical protein